MRGDEIDVLGQLRVLEPDVPGLGRADRLVHRRTRPVQQRHKPLDVDITPQQGLVANDQPHDVAVIPGQSYGFLELGLGLGLPAIHPGANGDIQVMPVGQCGDLGQRTLDRIAPHCMRATGQQSQILVNLFQRRIALGDRVLIKAKRGECEALDGLRPRRLGPGLIEVGPQAPGHDHQCQPDDQAGGRMF